MGDENALSQARETMSIADNYNFGLGDTLQDQRRALELYRQAGSLGYAPAYWRMGEILMYVEEFEDEESAIQAFKRGAELGDPRCWAEIANYYSRKGHSANAMKAWAHWFESEMSHDTEAPVAAGFALDYLGFLC